MFPDGHGGLIERPISKHAVHYQCVLAYWASQSGGDHGGGHGSFSQPCHEGFTASRLIKAAVKKDLLLPPLIFTSTATGTTTSTTTFATATCGTTLTTPAFLSYHCHTIRDKIMAHYFHEKTLEKFVSFINLKAFHPH